MSRLITDSQSPEWRIADLAKKVERLERALRADGDPWHVIGAAGSPAFTSAWANYGGTFQTARFRRLASGLVVVSGLVTGGATGTSVFTLPAGYRPAATLIFASNMGGAFTDLRVHADGTIIPTTGAASWLTLDVIRFVAEQ